MRDMHQAAAREYVRRVLETMEVDATTLAKRAKLASSTLTRFLNDPNTTHTLSARTLMKIADVSRVPIPPELGGSGTILPPPSAVFQGVGEAMRLPGAIPQPGVARDLPVRGQARGGSDGYFFGADMNGFVERPWFLLGTPKAYAVYVNGQSMEPVFHHGCIAYVNPTMPVGPGDDVVIQLRDGQGFVKRLVRRTDKAVVVHQFNPPKDITFAPDDLAEMHLIVANLRVRS